MRAVVWPPLAGKPSGNATRGGNHHDHDYGANQKRQHQQQQPKPAGTRATQAPSWSSCCGQSAREAPTDYLIDLLASSSSLFSLLLLLLLPLRAAHGRARRRVPGHIVACSSKALVAPTLSNGHPAGLWFGSLSHLSLRFHKLEICIVSVKDPPLAFFPSSNPSRSISLSLCDSLKWRVGVSRPAPIWFCSSDATPIQQHQQVACLAQRRGHSLLRQHTVNNCCNCPDGGQSRAGESWLQLGSRWRQQRHNPLASQPECLCLLGWLGQRRRSTVRGRRRPPDR